MSPTFIWILLCRHGGKELKHKRTELLGRRKKDVNLRLVIDGK